VHVEADEVAEAVDELVQVSRPPQRVSAAFCRSLMETPDLMAARMSSCAW